MTIEIAHFLNNISDSTYSSTGLASIFTNIVYTSILLSIILLIIICLIYPCKKNTPLWVLFKLTFYIFISVLAILYLHSGVLNHKYEKKYEDKTVKKIIGGINNPSPAYAGDKIEIKPILINKNPTTNLPTPIEIPSTLASASTSASTSASAPASVPESSELKPDFGSLNSEKKSIEGKNVEGMNVDEILTYMGV